MEGISDSAIEVVSGDITQQEKYFTQQFLFRLKIFFL